MFDCFYQGAHPVKLLRFFLLKIIEDIAGNSHVENPNAPKIDPDLQVNYFKRTKEQDHVLGIYSRDEVIFFF